MRKKRSRKKKLGVISNLVLLANLIAILALFGSYGASKIDPQTFWPLALLGLGYLPILVVNLCFMAYWLLRKPRYIVLSLAAILLGIPSLKKHFGLGIQSSDIPQKKETDLRVMSYNVHLFESIERGNKEG
ncbi:MAG TPA: endonuclease, partial [Candidatus Sphingobacterium stercoripullorum]|nr:endonuclease [Candidatus Sphingobacterium stercoripullorum]